MKYLSHSWYLAYIHINVANIMERLLFVSFDISIKFTWIENVCGINKLQIKNYKHNIELIHIQNII